MRRVKKSGLPMGFACLAELLPVPAGPGGKRLLAG